MYQQNIIDHYKNPTNSGKIVDASYTKHIANTTCGDEITIYVLLDGEIIKDIKFEGSGCAISMASSDILFESLKGTSISELPNITLQSIEKLLGISISPARHKCALLGLDGLRLIEK